jgi:hypothetical protein
MGRDLILPSNDLLPLETCNVISWVIFSNCALICCRQVYFGYRSENGKTTVYVPCDDFGKKKAKNCFNDVVSCSTF